VNPGRILQGRGMKEEEVGGRRASQQDCLNVD